MLVRSRRTSSVIDCRAYNGAQTGNEHGSDHAMVRARLRPRMKAAGISNRPAKLDTAKVKTVALVHIRLDLRNRFEGLQLDEEASPESLLKRFRLLSKRAWRGFQLHQITGI